MHLMKGCSVLLHGDGLIYFSVGQNEILEEWETRKDIDGLVLDDNIVVYYPLPRFFITHLDNEGRGKTHP